MPAKYPYQMELVISKGLMLMSKYLSVLLLIICSSANAIEWDATTWSVGGGLGLASFWNDEMDEGFVYSLSGGASVPLLVEQHVRASTLVDISFIPTEPQELVNRRGGNFFELGTILLLEHDLNLGNQMIWFGVGPKLSFRSIQSHYIWEQTGAQLQATPIDFDIATSASIVGRIEVPINQALSFALQIQASPFSNTYSAATSQFLIRF
jgi:hypothetical protein